MFATLLGAARPRRDRRGDAGGVGHGRSRAERRRRGHRRVRRQRARCSGRRGNRGPDAAPQGVYPGSATDSWVALAVETDAQWDALVTAVGSPAWAPDHRCAAPRAGAPSHDMLDKHLGVWTRERTRRGSGRRRSRPPACPPRWSSQRGTCSTTPVASRGIFENEDHPVTGSHPVPTLPFRFAHVAGWLRAPSPTLGQHNDEVLGELGVDADARAALAERRRHRRAAGRGLTWTRRQRGPRKHEEGAAMRRADDMILISVDDHIAEPADMFDRHVPGASTGSWPRASRPTSSGFQQWWYGDKQGPQPRAQRGGRQAPRDVQRQPVPLRRHAPGLLRRARAGARHVGRRTAGRAQLPQLDGVLGPGAQRGARPRRQRGHDQGLQRLARRRVVRRLPRALHPLRHPPALRRGQGGGRGATAWPPRDATPSRSRRTRPPCRCRRIHSGHWDPLFAACSDEGTVLCCHVGLVVEGGLHDADAPPSGGHEPVVRHVDLLPRRSDVGGLLVALPRPALLPHRRRHRLDPLLPPAGRAHSGPALGLDPARSSPRATGRPTCSASASCAASSTTRSA